MTGLRARTREQALRNLLGTSEVPASDDYPSQLTLPISIQDRRDCMVAATDEDMHCAPHFRYRFGRWCGGLVLKGTKPTAEVESGSIVVNTPLTTGIIGEL